MSSRYQKSHYEDVAELLRPYNKGQQLGMKATQEDIACDFADLFAADNPDTCIDCGAHRDETDPEGQCVNHLFAYGFDRAAFLAACGLESEG